MNIVRDQSSGNAISFSVLHVDPHVHGRRDAVRAAVLPQMATRLSAGVLMPNTNPHLLTHRHVTSYLGTSREIAPACQWLASIYLTPQTKPEDVQAAWDNGELAFVKWYPPGGSTHSDESVSPEALTKRTGPTGELLAMMEERGIPITLHGEVTHWRGEEIDPWDREAVFYQKVAPAIDDAFPALKRTQAHLTSKEGIAYMLQYGDPKRIIGEVTPHHLAVDRRAMYLGGFLRPDYHCLPVIKEHKHTAALREAVKSRPYWLVAGSDTAPHPMGNKYGYCCFGGIYTGHCSIEVYVEWLEKLGVLGYAEAFLYGNIARFNPKIAALQNLKPIRLVRREWTQDERIKFDGGEITPFGWAPEKKDRYRFQWAVAA